MQYPNLTINWRKVWKAMHDLQYKRVDLSTAIAIAKAAGHPAPAKLGMDTLTNGYAITRDIRMN
jgi:hypothetical protein